MPAGPVPPLGAAVRQWFVDELERDLSDAEARVAQWLLHKGRYSPVPAAPRLQVRSDFLAALILWITERENLAAVSGSIPSELVILNISVVGDTRFDFPFERLIPPISLIDCVFSGVLDFSDARITSLSLRSSRINKIIGRNSQFERDIDLRMLSPTNDYSSIDLRGTAIGGSLLLSGAKLQSSQFDPELLTLTDMTIEKNLILAASPGQIQTELGGTLNFSNSTIRGKVDARGVLIGKSEENRRPPDAVIAIDARVGTSVFFGDANIFGPIRLNGANIGADLDLCESELVSGRHVAVDLTWTSVGRRLLLRTFSADGAVHLDGCVVQGEVNFSDAELTAPKGHDGALILATNVKVSQFFGRNLTLKGGGLNLSGSQIQGRLSLDHIVADSATSTWCSE